MFPDLSRSPSTGWRASYLPLLVLKTVYLPLHLISLRAETCQLYNHSIARFFPIDSNSSVSSAVSEVQNCSIMSILFTLEETIALK